jgi:hypothetical protein
MLEPFMTPLLRAFRALLSLTVLTALPTPAATLYVWQESPSPAAPFTNWATAAHIIQDAVDAASAGDTVLATNGVYSTGGRTVLQYRTLNRVAVDRPLCIQSVNGPQFTIIHGLDVPSTGPVRCVYLTAGARLSGFTLTNGNLTHAGGGDNDLTGAGVYCVNRTAVVSNCVLSGNESFRYGGGVRAGTLDNCILRGNQAGGEGGGAAGAYLNNCVLLGNSASKLGADYGLGGGAGGCTLTNCTLSGNSADGGGGAYWSYLSNCLLTDNSALYDGGGTLDCFNVNNCTLSRNSAARGGGVADDTYDKPTLVNCVLYWNSADVGPNYCDGFAPIIMSYCCTTPMPTTGVGNITNQPAFVNPDADDFRLRYGSPCIDAGTNLLGITNDLDGHPRPLDGNGDGIAASDIGVYESVPPACYVWQDSPSPSVPFNTWATAAHTIQDAVDAARPGDTVLVTNGVYATGGKAVYGTMTNRVAVTKPIALGSITGPQFTVIEGYQVPETTNGDGAIRCAYLANGAILSGFTLTNGATRTDGDSKLEGSGGGLWCESTNITVSGCILTGNSASSIGGGAYSGSLTNCTLVGNSAAYGGAVYWGSLINCTLTGNSASMCGGAYAGTLNGCLLTYNSGGTGGGGAYRATLKNCTLAGNSGGDGGGADHCALDQCILAANAGTYGGGAYWGSLTNCTLTENAARWGGGAYSGTLNNCTLSGNWASEYGGGVYRSTLNNCLIYYNDARNSPNYAECGMSFCCTTPQPSGGAGNITNEPAFADLTGGDLHLQPNSPCINAGNNSYVATSPDLDGNPRVVSGTVDMGAYEYQGTGSTISYAWLQQYGLPTDGTADLSDTDRDGLNTWQEWQADTDPTNAASVLRVATISNSPPVAVTLSSSTGRLYTLLCCSNLTASAVWTPVPGQTDVAGSGDVLILSDTNPPAPAFYRVSVRFP